MPLYTLYEYSLVLVHSNLLAVLVNIFDFSKHEEYTRNIFNLWNRTIRLSIFVMGRREFNFDLFFDILSPVTMCFKSADIVEYVIVDDTLIIVLYTIKLHELLSYF